jgi:hypothetical protein
MIIDEELRNKLVEHLPNDYAKRGEESTGYSRSMIYKVLHEEHDNSTIADWLILTAMKEKKAKEKKLGKRDEIIKQL